jgi:hypothetical protein
MGGVISGLWHPPIQFFPEIEPLDKALLKSSSGLWIFPLAVNFGKKLNGGYPLADLTPPNYTPTSPLKMSASQSQSMMSEFATLKAAAARMEAELAELKQMLSQQQQKAPKAKQSKKAAKAESEAEGAEPKEKRPPSPWILFSVRVQKILRPAEEGKDKAERTPVGTMNQFAGTLWSQVKEGKEWSDEEISAAWATFTPPEVSKQTLEGKSKRSGSTGSGEEAEPVADEAPKKARKPQSEETKAAAAAKRAATKAKKAAEAAGAVAEQLDDDAEAEAPAAAVGGAGSVAAAAPAPPAAAPKPKAKITPKPKKVVDLFLDPFEHDGKEYLKNSRGDVTSAEGEWVGHWTGSAIDTDAPEPADFDQLTTRD